MVGHGGYYNRLEFEKVPFFDIYDPETEPLYPANLHTALTPLLRGKDRVIWVRPQMYEDVPFRALAVSRLRRADARLSRLADRHGPGMPALFRGLHGEMEFLKPIVYSRDPGPKIEIEPGLEHWSRRHQGKTYLIAATTHGIPLGRWRWAEAGRARRQGARHRRAL